ncbi:MAG: helix-turn-helix transcriptional regulator [Fimbriimonas sp.]|nr:helix-turn-helix transcriptional regulator [Fimbriimonas sp.]
MSKTRQHDDLELARSFAVTLGDSQLTPPISENWNAVVYATRGVVTVRSDAGTWVVPPNRAVWLPAGVPFRLEIGHVAELRMVYLRRPSAFGAREGGCRVLDVSPLLRELMLRIVSIGALFKNEPRHRRIVGLIADELQEAAIEPLALPYPRGRRIDRLMAGLDSHPPDRWTPDELIRESGFSRRTVERLFRDETGMSMGQWLRRYRLLQGLKSLADGQTASRVAFDLGYSSPSAFIAMFRRELGTTPGNYLANRSE